MFYFGKNDHEIIATCRCGARNDMLTLQQIDSGALMGIQGKTPEQFWSFNIWRAKK